MKILIWGRQTGKTTECIKTLRKNPDAILFVLTEAQRQAIPKELQIRTFSYHSIAWRGTPFKKAIFDECDFVEDKYLEDIELWFEIILVTTSIGKSYNNPNTWLRNQIINQCGKYSHKPTFNLLQRFLAWTMHIGKCAQYKKWLSKEMYEIEYLAKFKD